MQSSGVFLSEGCFQWYRLLRGWRMVLKHPKSSGRYRQLPERIRNFAAGNLRVGYRRTTTPTGFWRSPEGVKDTPLTIPLPPDKPTVHMSH